MNASRYLWPLLPLCLGTTWAGMSWAEALVPPKGYYAPVTVDQGHKAGTCPVAPPPFTGSLNFTSKYQGSDKARATLNAAAEKHYRDQAKPINDMEEGVSKSITRYMRDGASGDLDCALAWLDGWAKSGALLSTDFTHTGKSMRKWALASLSSSYLRLKFSSSQPLAGHEGQAREIEAWFSKVADQVVKDWSGLPLEKINNHSYWAAWSVMSVAVLTDRRDLFDWSVGVFKTAAGQVDKDGYLPNELRREQRALSYHNYSLPPLTMIAAFAQANGVDLRGENDNALQRLAQRVMEGVNDEDAFETRTGHKQDTKDLDEDFKFVWLEPYCSLYACSPKTLAWKKDMEPFSSYRVGGDVTAIFDPQAEEKAKKKS